MSKLLRILYKIVGKEAIDTQVEDTLEAKQKLVDGMIEVVSLDDDTLLVCNEEGKIENLRPNVLFDYDYIAGNCFVIGDDYENAGFKSLTDEQIKKYKKVLDDRSMKYEDIEFFNESRDKDED